MYVLNAVMTAAMSVGFDEHETPMPTGTTLTSSKTRVNYSEFFKLCVCVTTRSFTGVVGSMQNWQFCPSMQNTLCWNSLLSTQCLTLLETHSVDTSLYHELPLESNAANTVPTESGVPISSPFPGSILQRMQKCNVR